MATFCVTGASGFVGSEVVATLLAAGHTVRGTVRDTSDLTKYAYLTDLAGADERLTLHQANLLDDGSFDEAVQGCDHVLHTASPYVVTVDDPQRDLVEPALHGTRNVLRSCLGVEGLQRVVVTSSLAAVTDEARDGYVFSEDDWTTKASLDRNPYYFSKVEAERAAWAFVEEHQPSWDLVTVNPSLVIGPARNPGLNQSNETIRDVAEGRVPGIAPLEFVVVDIRDVAEAHLLAATTPQAAGRFITCAETRSMSEIADVVRRTYSRHRVPKVNLDNAFGGWMMRTIGWRTVPKGAGDFVRTHAGRELRASNAKSREVLGMTYRDVDQSIVDALDDMIEWGHVRHTSR